MQVCPAPQVALREHWGATSCASTQYPSLHKVPEQAGPQFWSDSQSVRQMAFTHSRSTAQSLFERHCGVGRPSGWHTLAVQASARLGQSPSTLQPPWQKPLIHSDPALQSVA